MTEELITAANKDRSVSNADRLLTPGSDKAGDLGEAALLPAPDGVSLLGEGASDDERKPRLLRRIGGYVAGLASRLTERAGWRSADENYKTADNTSGDSENEDSHEEEELDELTLRRIDKIDEEWEFRADVDGFNGNFIPKSYPDFAGSIASGNYEEIEKLVPDVRELLANHGAHITGYHSAVDFDFEVTIKNMVGAARELLGADGKDIHMPPGTNIVRPYRKDGVTRDSLANIERARQCRRRRLAERQGSDYAIL